MFTDFIKSLYWEFLSYFVPERQDYKIVGECKKCGKCCRNVYSAYMYSEKEFETNNPKSISKYEICCAIDAAYEYKDDNFRKIAIYKRDEDIII